MTPESILIEELWETIKGFTPAKQKTEVLYQLFRLLQEYGIEQEDFEDLLDHDDLALKKAFIHVYELDLDEKDDEEED
jgi:hypothetical protein